MAKAASIPTRFAPVRAAPERRAPLYSNLLFADGRVDASVLCRIANRKANEGETRSEIFRGLWLMARLMQSAIIERRKQKSLPIHERHARAHEFEIALLTHKRDTAATHRERVYYHQKIASRQAEIDRLRAIPDRRAA